MERLGISRMLPVYRMDFDLAVCCREVSPGVEAGEDERGRLWSNPATWAEIKIATRAVVKMWGRRWLGVAEELVK